MAKTIRGELKELKYEFQLLEKVACSDDDTKKYREYMQNGTPLPAGIEYSKNYGVGNEFEYYFYTVNIPDLSNEEKQEYIMLKKLKSIDTIKKCVVFFTTLTVISIISTILLFLTNL